MTKPNNSHPLVTVYMPTYNRVGLLQRAVDSVLSQDYKNIELIVVDDNSTDSTHQYLAEMAEKDSRFRYFINEKNSGACVSRNKAIFAANGEYITGLDDDDYFLPNHLSNLVRSWSKINTNCIALYANCYVKNETSQLLLRNKISKCKSKDLIVANWIGNQIFTKTEYLRSIGGFDEKLPAWQDLECWYRLLKKFSKEAHLSNDIHTYVIDTSHSHERITTSKVDSIIEAYDYFSTKNYLTKKERKIMSLQLIPYTNSRPSISAILYAVAYSPTFYSLKRALVLGFKAIS